MTGKEILNYRIERLLGRGGMGSVYLAVNKNMNQKVAVKVLNAHYADSETVRRRFREEADMLCRLDHPHIVKFLNYVENADGMFLIMEYVDGITLEEFITSKNGLIVEARARDLFDQILDAFTCAHKRDVVHCDIKPANIILTGDREGHIIVKVLDFGIAKIISESDRDEAGMIVGTPSYMSPEQVEGRPLDARSDIYSLGVLLHQMLTGSAPYDSTTLSEAEIHDKVLSEPLARMKEFYPYISDKAQKIVDRAVAKKPDDRFRNCAEFRKAWHDAFPAPVPPTLKYAAAAALVLLLGAGAMIWDYHRTKVCYYKDYVEVWGVPRGIHKLGKSEFRHRAASYRFEYRARKLQTLARVNSRGNVVEDTESERSDRPVNAAFRYRENGHIDHVLYLNGNGKTLFKKLYNERDGKINMLTFQYDDEYGTEKRLPEDMTGYVKPYDETADRGQISRFALEFDANGFVSSIHYRSENFPAGDGERIYGKRYERDEKGRIIREYCLARNDSVKATSWGLGIKQFKYDDRDDWIEAVYLTPDGSPSCDAKDGVCVYAMEYDNYGNTVCALHKSPDGENLMLPERNGVAGLRQKYDREGNLIETVFLGTDKKPACPKNSDVYKNTGNIYAGVRYEYDDRGYVNRETYIDENGLPTASRNGNAITVRKNDTKGNPLEIQYLDIDNLPCETTGGYAKLVMEYDSPGNHLSSFYYGANDLLCISGEGIAGYRWEYNDLNRIVKVTGYGTDRLPAEDLNGIIVCKYEYDIYGNQTKCSFYDAGEKNLKLSDEGIAGWKSTCENGRETQRAFFDENENPTSGYLKYASRETACDEMGNILKIRYYDTKKNLTLSPDGCAGFDYKYDDRGNTTETARIGEDGKYQPGYLIVKSTYDPSDNETERALYDSGHQPALNTSGYHKVRRTYDSRKQILEERYLGKEDNRPVALAGSSVAIIRYEYDPKGNVIRQSWFNTSDHPTAGSEGYAVRKNEYDAMGRLVRQTYFDENGAPTRPSVFVPEGLAGYDKWGNRNYIASADGSGRTIDNPHTGWAIRRSEYDMHGNLLSESWYDKNDKPCTEKNTGAAKVEYTCNRQGKRTETRYYDTDGAPRKNNHAVERALYDERGRIIETAVYDHSGQAVDSRAGFHKVIHTYDEQGNPQYRKYYTAANRLLATTVYDRQSDEWKSPSVNAAPESWREYWKKGMAECPYADPENGIEVSSVALTADGCEITVRFPEVSRYDISEADLEIWKTTAGKFARQQKQASGMPAKTRLTIIALDRAKRELFRITN
ncbi:MAG: protein kinase [Tannerella sp.]|jgi:serine/threonine-protein kinase|nr:protein kinase [Tannerella sp.]